MREPALVLDDEKDLVDLPDDSLRQAGFQGRTALNERAAPDSARRDHPSLALLDPVLQEASEIEVLKTLRQEPSTRATPAILFTAPTEGMDPLAGFELGSAVLIRESVTRTKPNHNMGSV
jgi:DNA-binding response OmpR family regulator